MPVVEEVAQQPSRNHLRTRLSIGLALALVAGAVVAVVLVRRGGPGCTAPDHPVAAGAVAPVFDTDPPLAAPDDARLRRLVRAARSWHLGDVVGAVGYDYGQWLTVAALPGRLGAWTKQNPVFGVLDPATLAPAWGIAQGREPHGYDATTASDRSRFLGLTEPRTAPAELSAYSLRDGDRLWCTPVGVAPAARDPGTTAPATLPMPDGAVLVLTGRGPARTLTRVDADGSVVSAHRVRGLDRADFLGGPWGPPGRRVVVAGGRPQYELADAADGGPVLAGLEPATGTARWRLRVPRGSAVHVLGGTADAVVLLRQRGDGEAGGQRLVAVDPADGSTRWRTTLQGPRRPVLDAALFGDTVVVRDRGGLRGYDAGTGRPVWSLAVPATPQPWPYGFRLDQQPMPDATHVLLGGTRALRLLDLRTGRFRDLALPTDGISTTFWPYQLAVTGRLLVVVTNTGAVAVRSPG